MELVRQARQVSQHVVVYFSDVTPLAYDALHATVQTGKLYCQLVVLALRPFFFLLVQLYYLLMPPLTILVRRSVIALTLQPRGLVLFELGVLTLIFTLINLERRFSIARRSHALYTRIHARLTRRYRLLQAQVRTKSRTAAVALPHVLFVAIAAAFHHFIGHRTVPLLRGAGLVAFACVRPAMRTVALLYAVDIETKGGEQLEQLATPGSKLVTPPMQQQQQTKIMAGNDSPVVQSAPAAVAKPVDVLSDGVRRRRRPKEMSPLLQDTDAVRQRAATVAADIENDGDGANVSSGLLPNLFSSSSRRVRIDDATSISRKTRTLLLTPTVEKSPAGTPPNKHAVALVPALSEDVARASAERRILRFWTVFGAAWGLRSLIWFFCPSILVHVVAVADVWLFYLVVWAQFSLTTGADLLYAPLAAFLQRHGLVSRAARRVASRVRGATSFRGVARGPTSRKHGDNDDDDDTAQQLGLLLRLASSLRLTDALKSGRLWRFVIDSGLAVGLFFIFAATPRIITYVATLVVGVLLPCMRSTAALEGDDVGDVDDTALRRHSWLAYWGVFSLLDAFYSAASESLAWLPLWYHFKMAAIVWLQVPNFRGSILVLDWLMSHVGAALSTVKQATVTPRKRKRM